MKIFVLLIVCFAAGIWSGKKLTDFRWTFNALERYPLEHNGWRYKVERGQNIKPVSLTINSLKESGNECLSFKF